MSESEDDEDYAFFGTPLEQFDEDAVPRKKPVSIEDQIVTDSHGRRRFHGAFTGGFSAGFFNSVGSLEGWKPSTFKSSRNERSKIEQQLPSHFMDNEDVEEFGIAPQVLKTKPEYSSTKRNSKKRDRDILNSGPIPGEPVLKSILKPAKHSMGILLLMKMGWKPGDEIGEKLKRKSNKKLSSLENKTKIYGCARGPEDERFSSAAQPDESSSDDDEIYRELGQKAPSFARKEDTMGLGYKGLDRSALSMGGSKASRQITLRDQFNKTIKISGQAFGVGAFEEEDDDIYSTDDKSQYDFSLEPLNSKSKKSKNSPAITDGNNVILGFIRASFKEVAKIYRGPKVPANFTGRHVEKISRFDVGPTGQKSEPQRQKLDADLRSVILDTAPTVRIKEEKPDDEEKVTTQSSQEPIKSSVDNKWKPFDSDPLKQERYEKYLNLIKIGAKDLVHTVLLNTMTDLERESEMREFEGAARLYSGNLMSDRFTHGGLNDGPQIKEEMQRNDNNVRRRVNSDWAPHPIVCKRFNIRPPDNVSGTSLQSVAESSRKPKFSVFDFLNASKSVNLADLVESNAKDVNNGFDAATRCELVSSTAADSSDSFATPISPQLGTTTNVTDLPNTSTAFLAQADDDNFEEPADKMDLFKAIFLDSDDDEEVTESDDSKVVSNDAVEPSNSSKNDNLKSVNILRNTSPPRGIFANLNLDELSNKRVVNDKSSNKDALKLTAPPAGIFENDKSSDTPNVTDSIKEEPKESDDVPENIYGPSLPKIPVEKPKSYVNLELDIADDRWIEKSSKDKSHRSTEKSSKECKDKHRHKHHKKKHKKEKKREKHKKKKKRKSSSSSSDSSE